MGDINSRDINSSFQGLVTTTAIVGGVGGAAIIGYEVLRQFRRLPATRISRFWRKDPQLRHPPGGVQDTAAHTRTKDTCEDWEMGHLYHARVFHATTPSPPLPRWPFAWIRRAILFDDNFFAEHTGMDTVVYVRFLRACLYWVLLQTLTTAPILLTIHIKFSRGVDPTDMARASLSYLVTEPAPGSNCTSTDSKCETVPNEAGRRLLWIHLTLLWYLSITWILALWWLGFGSLKIRRAQIEKTREKVRQSKDVSEIDQSQLDQTVRSTPHQLLSSAQGVSSDNSDGWRQRTLMIMNLPATMRDEASIRRYFEEFLRPDDSSILSIDNDDHHLASSQSPHQHDAEHQDSAVHDREDDRRRRSSDSDGPDGPQPDLRPDRHLKSPVQTVVLVRKMNELASMLARRQDILNQLEAAHIKLAQDVLVTVGKRTLKMRKRESQQAGQNDAGVTPPEGKGHGQHLQSLFRHPFHHSSADKDALDAAGTGESTPQEALPPDLEKMATKLTSIAKANEEELARRLARFSPTNKGHHAKQVQVMGTVDSDAEHEMPETIWEALHQLPRELLDPFQPATRLSALFRGQTVPTIDYLLTKLNLLTALVTEMRSRPPNSYEPTSTAFVTFRDPRQARMVWRELKDQIVVKVRLAPEVKDLDWDRLMKTSFTGNVVRGFGVSVATWAFTIFWVIIINFITIGIFSVKNLKQIPGLSNFLDQNPNIEGFISITLPPIIVSLISMSVPELIFQVSKRAQGFVTFSALYDMCLIRYWKFVICNVVIFFCVGSTVIETVLTKVGNSGTILDTIGRAFPSAAPFFVSYLILQLALQSGFEHVGFMIAILQHWGARKAVTPRTRAIKTLPRNFNRYYWLPLHLNIMAIVFIFALLNPLMIPFALIYLSVALVIFKKNFAYHYYRRFNEMQGVIYFIRILRYSLDAIVVMQAVLLIFFSVIREGPVYIGMTAVLIPLTVIVKLIATRLWKSQCRAVDDEEAEALCGIDSRPLWEKMQTRDYGPGSADDATDIRSPLDARASGRYPAVVPPPPTESAFHRAWQRVHDSFNANGLDKPSYLASAHAKGKRTSNPMEMGARGIAKTPKFIFRETVKHAFHYRTAAKATLGMDPMADTPRASADRRSGNERISGLPNTSQLHEHHFDKTANNGESNASAEAKSAQQADVSRRRKGDYGESKIYRGLRRSNTRRSEERPFLSGFDAVSAHAPVPSEDDYDLSFEDGDAPFLARYEGERTNSPRRSRPLSYSHSTIKRKRSQLATVKDEEGNETMEDYDMRSDGMSGSRAAEPLFRAGKDTEAPETSHLSMPTGLSEPVSPNANQEADENEDEDEDLLGRELVRPHPPVRWDDTPNNAVRYNNPFYNQEMDGFLWLPRNPLAPLDLCDTIEWYGPALVSSQGGRGVVGEWEDDQEDTYYDDGDEDHEKGMNTDDDIPFGGEASDMKSRAGLLAGDEEIVLPDGLARHLEEIENVEEAVDPAASVPKHLMEDYKRAIRKSTHVESDSSSRDGRSSSLFRRGSMVSAGSGGGYAGSPLLQIPSKDSGRYGEKGEQSSSPVSFRGGSQPETMGSDPLSSVPEVGVMIPRRSTSRRNLQNEDSGAHAAQTDKSNARDGATTPTTPTTPVTPGSRTPRPQPSITFAAGHDADPLSPTRAVERDHHGHVRSASRPMRRDASGGMSRASAISGGTVQKSVTLRAALRAEALEEERRLTLKERLSSSAKRRGRASQREASMGMDELAEGMDEAEGGEGEGVETLRGKTKGADTIMGRYEARHRRLGTSEFGATVDHQGSHFGDMSSSSTNAARFRSAALGVLSLTRTGRVQKRSFDGASNNLAMQDIKKATLAVEEPAHRTTSRERGVTQSSSASHVRVGTPSQPNTTREVDAENAEIRQSVSSSNVEASRPEPQQHESNPVNPGAGK